MSPNSPHQVIRPPHSLGKAKLGSGPGKIDHDLIARAEAAIEEMKAQFPAWAKEDVQNLRDTLGRVRKSPEDQAKDVAQIFTSAIDLKGLGSTFDFPLITAIGDSLKKFTEGRDDLTPRDAEIVEAHIDALHVVLSQEIRGDGGETGRGIVEGLRRLTVDHAKQSKEAIAAAG